MHELGLTQSIVAMVDEAAAGRRVRRVTLEIGRLSGVVPDAIAFCFDVVAAGTALDGAKLEIREVPGRGRCRACGATQDIATLFDPCACGAYGLELVQGDKLAVKEMEVDD